MPHGWHRAGMMGSSAPDLSGLALPQSDPSASYLSERESLQTRQNLARGPSDVNGLPEQWP